MSAFRLGLVALLVVTALAALDLALELPHLPAHMATHFDLHGQADGWSTPAGFAWSQILAQGVFLLFFGGLAGFLPKLPLGLLNVPHKAHWFAPERRAASMAFVQAWLSWFGAWTQAFMTLIFHDIHRLNRSAAGGPGWLPFVVFFAGFGVGMFFLFRRFGRPR